MQAAGNGDYSSDNLGSNDFLNFRVLSEIRDKEMQAQEVHYSCRASDPLSSERQLSLPEERGVRRFLKRFCPPSYCYSYYFPTKQAFCFSDCGLFLPLSPHVRTDFPIGPRYLRKLRTAFATSRTSFARYWAYMRYSPL